MAGVEVVRGDADLVRIRIDHEGRRTRHSGGIPQGVVEALVLQGVEGRGPTAEGLAPEIQVDEGERTQETEGGAVGVECLDGLSRPGWRVGGERDPAGDLFAQGRERGVGNDDGLGLTRPWQLTGSDAISDDENGLGPPASQLANPPGCTGEDAADQDDLASEDE